MQVFKPYAYYKKTPRNYATHMYHILDGLSESSSISILCDQYQVLALSHKDTNELKDVGVVKTLQ